MRKKYSERRHLIVWQILFLLLGTSWLWAVLLNHHLSSHVTLISQYETSGQSYAWLFRLCDILSGSLLLGGGWHLLKKTGDKTLGWLVIVIALGSIIDPIFTANCHIVGRVCHEYTTWISIIHGVETLITAFSILLLSGYDYRLRKRLVSLMFLIFQLAYGLFLFSNVADRHRFNTVSQFIYQSLVLVWLAWLYRDRLMANHPPDPRAPWQSRWVRNGFAAWLFLNGLFAILVSVGAVHVFHRFRPLYFASDTAWVAQHTIIIGVVMLYLSRQLARGERRARQLLLVILGLEVIKYAVILPSHLLLALYSLTFTVLFALGDYFDRGSIARTLSIRLKDALYMITAVLVAAGVAFVALTRTKELSDITFQSIDHFTDYTLRNSILSHTHLRPALLARTITAFAAGSIAIFLWIFFRPYRPTETDTDYTKVAELLQKYSQSTEDFFKLWPTDKQFFWAQNGNGFIAYKISGPVAYALPDPICPVKSRLQLIRDFKSWCRTNGLKVCFIPVENSQLALYQTADLNTIQIGSSALVNRHKFLEHTSRNKWWRWKTNRALKAGYSYHMSLPPHSPQFVAQLRTVSDEWLTIPGRKERSFALGYFDVNYLQHCIIHSLQYHNGDIVAFTNQLPSLRPSHQTTVDLLRYRHSADDAMPYLLKQAIEENAKFQYFDLGLVPFASTNSLIAKAAQTFARGRFSSKGLEQFKNKFEPEWQAIWLAYEGDLGDLAVVATNLEKVLDQ